MGDWNYEDRTIRHDSNWCWSSWFICSDRSCKKGLKPIVFDENAKPGGQLFKQIHKFFGSKEHKAK